MGLIVIFIGIVFLTTFMTTFIFCHELIKRRSYVVMASILTSMVVACAVMGMYYSEIIGPVVILVIGIIMVIYDIEVLTAFIAAILVWRKKEK